MADLYDRKPGSQFLEYANQKKRTVSVYVLMDNRIPKEIMRTEYHHLFFDAEGFIDQDIAFEHMALGSEHIMEEIESAEREKGLSQSNVIHKAGYFGLEKYKRDVIWEPTEDIQRKVIQTVLPMGPRE